MSVHKHEAYIVHCSARRSAFRRSHGCIQKKKNDISVCLITALVCVPLVTCMMFVLCKTSCFGVNIEVYNGDKEAIVRKIFTASEQQKCKQIMVLYRMLDKSSKL